MTHRSLSAGSLDNAAPDKVYNGRNFVIALVVIGAGMVYGMPYVEAAIKHVVG